MGLSIAISGAIILGVMIFVLFSLPGLVDNMFSIGDVSTQVAKQGKSISDTEISMDHMSVLVGSSKVNFTLNNLGSEKLWNFEDFDLFIEYEGAATGKLIESLSFTGDCSGVAPSAGNWCIQSIASDVLDPGILNDGENASIWTQVNENLATNSGVISVTTDNGVVSTVSTTTCGSYCYQMSWHVVSDESQIDWGGLMGCGIGCIEELDQNDHFRVIKDLTDMSEWRFISFIESPNGGAGCQITVQYSTDTMVTWRGFDNGVANSISDNTNDCSVSQTYTVSPWSPLNATAQADVWLRIVADAPNTSSTDIGTLEVQFRS